MWHPDRAGGNKQQELAFGEKFKQAEIARNNFINAPGIKRLMIHLDAIKGLDKELKAATKVAEDLSQEEAKPRELEKQISWEEKKAIEAKRRRELRDRPEPIIPEVIEATGKLSDVPEPAVFTAESLAETMNVPLERVQAAFAIVESLGLDVSQVFTTSGVTPPDIALRQVGEAARLAAEQYDKTSNEKMFFGSIWPRVLRRAGHLVRGFTTTGRISEAGMNKAVDAAMEDLKNAIRDIPHAQDYYGL